MEGTKLKILTLLLTVGVVGLNLSMIPRIKTADSTGDSFRIEKYTGNRVSNRAFPLCVYVLGLTNVENYKLSKLYAQNATTIAQDTISPLSDVVLISGFIIIVPFTIALLLFYRLSALRGQEGLLARIGPRIKWWLLFLVFSEPEQHHRIMGLQEMGSVGSSLLTAAIWALGPLIVSVGVLISSAINPSFIVVGTLLSVVIGVLAWLEFLHILYDRPPKKETLAPMMARYNASLNIYLCPKCLFPLDGNGGTCKVCSARIDPTENATEF